MARRRAARARHRAEPAPGGSTVRSAAFGSPVRRAAAPRRTRLDLSAFLKQASPASGAELLRETVRLHERGVRTAVHAPATNPRRSLAGLRTLSKPLRAAGLAADRAARRGAPRSPARRLQFISALSRASPARGAARAV